MYFRQLFGLETKTLRVLLMNCKTLADKIHTGAVKEQFMTPVN